MNNLTEQKIFVDPSEEVSFVLDRIKASDTNKVILVIPQNSVIFASALTLKILYRMSVEESKQVIIVTEDSYGVNISQKAGFIVVNKVSQITTDLWEVVDTKVDTYKFEKQEKRNRMVEKSEETEADVNQAQSVEDNKSKDLEEVEGVSNSKSEKIEESTKEITLFEDEDFNLSSEPDTLVIEKVKKVGKIEVFLGEDIEVFSKEYKNVKIDKLDNFGMAKRNINTSTFGENKFAGRDLTRSVANRKKGMGEKLKGFFGISTTRKPESEIKQVWYKRKSFIGFTVILFSGLIFTYLAVFEWSRASIIVYLETESVETDENLEIDLSREEVDIDQRIIPGELVPGTEDSRSRTGTATGEETRGEKASGAIYIFNKTSEDITLAAGTRFVSTNSNNAYELVNAVTLPAAEEGEDLSTTPSRTDNILISATEVGEEFNIENSADSSFTIDGFEGFSELEARQDSDFTGGNQETFVSVAEEDVEQVKKSILEELEPSAIRRLRSEVPAGFILLEDSIEVEELEISSVPDVGEEAEDANFDLSVTVVAKGVAVSEQDLETIISTSIALNSETDSNRNVDSVEGIQVTDFSESESGIFITIAAAGDVSEDITSEDVLNTIGNKSITSATEELKKIDGVRTFEMEVFPNLLPDFLKIVPNDLERVDIEFR